MPSPFLMALHGSPRTTRSRYFEHVPMWSGPWRGGCHGLISGGITRYASPKAGSDSQSSGGNDALARFPSDFNEALRQAQKATEAALNDPTNSRLLEIEFPVVSLSSVQGDGEGANEMTYSSQHLRQYSRMFMEDAQTTRIFFPDKKEKELQSREAWKETKFSLDYLTKPTGLLDIGIDISGYDPLSNVNKESDKVFIAAYPSFDPRELVACDKVQKFALTKEDGCFIFFNAELDRLRSNYYPGLFYPEMSRLSKEMMPKVTPVYYIHNFKGTGGVLFRVYPGPWQVLLRVGEDELEVVHTQENQPTLKEVALEILPKAALEYRKRSMS
jgi:hypothetical protein